MLSYLGQMFLSQPLGSKSLITLNHTRFKLTPSTYLAQHRHQQSIPLFKFTNDGRVNPLFIGKTHNRRASNVHPSRFSSQNAGVCYANMGANIADNHKSSESQEDSTSGKSFWGAVGLIIGTAVGPGMLGLPAATIKSGPFPSTVVILLSWVYVISSIVLVAELSFAAMEDDVMEEVSFTSIAAKALGNKFGAFIALVYASLSFSLLVACVSGIGSIVSQWFPWMNVVIAHALFPSFVATVILSFPFKAIDLTNRVLCSLMLLSITALVAIGLSMARTSIMSSFAHASWNISSILPAVPVAVLTLGFHVITPFICKIAGNTFLDARKAILIGGAVPLVMVLSWNLIVLGLQGTKRGTISENPISLLLSVNPSALSAVQGFAFSALATSLIGYAVSFPKQILDTLDLILGKTRVKESYSLLDNSDGDGRVGFALYSRGKHLGTPGSISFQFSKDVTNLTAKVNSSMWNFDPFKIFLLLFVLGISVIVASFFPSTFSRALDYAGVYANCFLFGILPPAMAYIQQSRKEIRSSVLLGGDLSLLLLFIIAVILGIWH